MDNPKWWTDGIAPILEDERVYTLQWQGCKKKASGCWTHVCAELARHVFVPFKTRKAFRQNNVDEFLVAAGYVVGPAASNSTGNYETKQGEAGAAYLTAPAAASPAAGAAIEEASLNFTARRMVLLHFYGSVADCIARRCYQMCFGFAF